MIEVILYVCLIVQPQECKTVPTEMMAEKVTPYECMFKGQVHASRWVASYPEWRVTKWKCQGKKDFSVR